MPRFSLGFVPTSGLDTPISQVNDDGLFISVSAKNVQDSHQYMRVDTRQYEGFVKLVLGTKADVAFPYFGQSGH